MSEYIFIHLHARIIASSVNWTVQDRVHVVVVSGKVTESFFAAVLGVQVVVLQTQADPD